MRRRSRARPVLCLIPTPKQRLQRRPAKWQTQKLFEAPRDRKEGTSRDVRDFQSFGRSLQQGMQHALGADNPNDRSRRRIHPTARASGGGGARESDN